MNAPVWLVIWFEQTGTLMSSFYGKDRTPQFLSAASNVKNYSRVQRYKYECSASFAFSLIDMICYLFPIRLILFFFFLVQFLSRWFLVWELRIISIIPITPIINHFLGLALGLDISLLLDRFSFWKYSLTFLPYYLSCSSKSLYLLILADMSLCICLWLYILLLVFAVDLSI
jgi:hypothetical protein